MRVVKSKTGKKITLLNPAEKGIKYAIELKEELHATNDHVIKRNKKGRAIRLSDTQKAWRAGYLTARKDNAKAYKSNLKKKKSK